MAILSSRTSGAGRCEVRARERGATPPVRLCTLRLLVGRVLALILIVAVSLIGSALRGTAQSSGEYEIKAAFLYNFAKFVEWPAEAFVDPQAPFVLGVVGEDPFGSVLAQTVGGKTVNGRQLMVRRFKHGEDLRGCHILFVSSSEKKHLAQILESLKGSSVLTVGETDRFAQFGGAVNFILEANKVRFEINVDAAARARLKLSSKLLALARIVADQRRDGKG